MLPLRRVLLSLILSLYSTVVHVSITASPASTSACAPTCRNIETDSCWRDMGCAGHNLIRLSAACAFGHLSVMVYQSLAVSPSPRKWLSVSGCRAESDEVRRSQTQTQPKRKLARKPQGGAVVLAVLHPARDLLPHSKFHTHSGNFGSRLDWEILNTTSTNNTSSHTVAQDDQAHQEGRRDVRFPVSCIILCLQPVLTFFAAVNMVPGESHE